MSFFSARLLSADRLTNEASAISLFKVLKITWALEEAQVKQTRDVARPPSPNLTSVTVIQTSPSPV